MRQTRSTARGPRPQVRAGRCASLIHGVEYSVRVTRGAMARNPNPGSDSPARGGRLWLRIAAVGLAGAITLLLAVVLALQTPWGVHAAANLALRLANPWPDSELDAA